MVVALLKFRQGATQGDDGEALLAVVSADPVVIENANNAGVGSWELLLLERPYGSATTIGVLAQANGSTPTSQIAPDVAGGCWRVQLTVWPLANRQGIPDVDIRDVGILGANGLLAPPAMVWPLPLPPVESGRPNAKPNELNFSGQEDGWAGSGSDGLLRHLIRIFSSGGGGAPIVAKYFDAELDPSVPIAVTLYTVPTGGDGFYELSLAVTPNNSVSDSYPLYVRARVAGSAPVAYLLSGWGFQLGSEGGPAAALTLNPDSYAGRGSGSQTAVYLREGETMILESSAYSPDVIYTCAAILRLVALRAVLEA